MNKILCVALVACAPLLHGAAAAVAPAPAAQPGLLFHLSADNGTTADFSAANTPRPTYEAQVTPVADGARGGALECADLQLLAYRAPGNIYAQRGTLSFFWRSRYPVGPTEFPVFRVGYADHSSWDMVWLRIDYNGHGFDAFVTDASLSRTRVSVKLDPFPGPKAWTHLAFAWDETRGVRFYVNGKLAGRVDTTARYDAALDQFGPHSRIISPYQVQSDYNFVRGGDIDEVRIHDRMLDDAAVAALAISQSPAIAANTDRRTLSDPRTRAEWWHRYGFDRMDAAPPALPPGPVVAVRKVEIHDAFDLQRWWWKANDGIRETTWPGVYNRSRLPGRNDYFQLPDWDCYVESGKAVTFTLPNEPWNQLEIAGSAWGAMTRENGARLFDRAKGHERTVHRLAAPLTGGKITFTNVDVEEPIGELAAFNVTAGREPAGSSKRTYELSSRLDLVSGSLAPAIDFRRGRYAPDESASMIAWDTRAPERDPSTSPGKDLFGTSLPIVHVFIPAPGNETEGLDGIAIDLPALKVKPTHGDLFPLNLQVKDPLWPNRNLLDFTFSVKPGEARTLWLDLRDRILPKDKALWLTIAAAGDDFNAAALVGSALRLVFKTREAARAEHEIDRFTQLRDSYAMLVEERPNNPRLDLWNRFKGDLDDLLRVNPEHLLGRQYAAAAVAGTPRPAYAHPAPPAGVPLWAVRQTELLGWVEKFVMFYVNDRQSAYGDFGGGISDDVDLTNLWPGVALMGVEPDKIRNSLRALLDAAYKNEMFTRGLPAIQADELHSYEEGINTIAQNLLLDQGSPRQLERAMETSLGIETVTGINAAGHRHFRSSYYSGSKMAVEDPWGVSKPYSNLVLQVPQALVDYNGNPAAKKYLLELADGMLAHRRPATTPGGRATLAPAIHFASDRELPSTRGTFPWHVFWGPWKWTREKRFLDPIIDGGPGSALVVNANALDLLDLRPALSAPGPATPAPETPARGRGGRGGAGGFAGNTHFQWQLTGDKAHLERLYTTQIETCANLHFINTEGSLWIDRVSVPTGELQRARLGGIALVRNALFPGHVVSWDFAAPATARSVAILIPDATPTSFKVIAYNLDNSPVRAALTGCNIDPGIWEITQGTDTNDDDTADGNLATRTAPFERSRSVELTLAPRATSVLTFKLKSPASPYWSRPDLGIGREDVARDGTNLRVTIHGLGSVAAPESSVTVRDAARRVLATARIPALAAPVDLRPKTAIVNLAVPVGASLVGATVEIDPDQRLDEITKSNNTVKL